jgi:hypothetical protein
MFLLKSPSTAGKISPIEAVFLWKVLLLPPGEDADKAHASCDPNSSWQFEPTKKNDGS